VSALRVMAVVATRGGLPTAAGAELLGLARRLCAPGGGEVSALALGTGAGEKLIARGADRVLCAADGALADYESERWTTLAERAAKHVRPRVILLSHDSCGADLAPRLAFRLDGMVATGCVAVTLDGDSVTVERPCYGGNAQEVVVLCALPAVVTVRHGCADAFIADDARHGEVTALESAVPDARARVVERRRESGAGVSLEDARVVVAGGRGLNGAEGFEALRDLARQMGGAVGASRVPCDLGWCPHSMQIGLTGKTVTPELYVAVGISGAGHHLAGCGGAKNIVAINTDAGAPIFKHARFGLVGDYRALVPALARAVAAMKAAGAA